ncbi:sulfate ABC transporter permease subunit CysT [Gordonia desulfuricans]|uniref:Sulfate transport system permease protein CysT n=1 Tax=Gordonia desulfuricans TaxID=89051 RepID=A0A7K3LJH7_9ACTN|nr:MULTISPECIES: sulfate ABC transporter permease subunit CysT [Gordonia]EMP12021.1 sulfate ABC transporter permease [Gordonia sp. NB41Y]NDK88374.1 sulfate ABC transporter permease subunit CysT [Gordonia desulfuricans]WLP90185.1 sulfate ABC transporter permease subunit CysT [Gordonia sp. NB41Y]
MTSVDSTTSATATPVPDSRPPGGFLGRSRTFAGVSPATIGIAWLWLSIIVLLPLAAITVQSFDDGWSGFWDAVTAPAALDTLWITVLVSVIAALINVVFGTLIAWVLVRDEFPGKGFVNAIIDLPFALPTIVASLVLLSLYGPNSPIDIQLNATKPALVIALTFVTLPFVVRQVQPVLIELDVDVEEAAAVLGAKNLTIFRKIVMPSLLPAILTGAGLAFTRAIGEFGSVVLIGGNIPGDTQVASQYIQQQIEIDAPVDAAAISVVLLLIAFVTLLVLRVAGRWQSKREDADR